MKVIARHGFIAFYPDDEREIKTFDRLFKIELIPEKDYFTFEGLIGLPRYSLSGAPYGNLVAIETYEGRDASEVMTANQFVYHLGTGLLVPLLTILATANLPQTSDYLIAPSPFLQPGAMLKSGQRVLSYRGKINLDTQRLYIHSMELSA